MQCGACGSKWESKTEVTNCPFCGHSLQLEKKPNEIGISDVIAHIISTRGHEVLKNSKVVTSYVMDLVQGREREKKLFRVLCNYDIFTGAYKIAITTDPMERDIIIKKQFKILTDEAFLSDEIATDALNIILKGLGVKELSLAKPNASVVVTPETQKKDTTATSINKQKNTDKSSSSPQTKTVSQNVSARIDTYHKYQKALEEYYVRLGKQPLTETQIRHFISVNSLDRNWNITVEDVRKDLKDVYAKYTSGKTSPVKTTTSTVTSSRTLFAPNKRLSTYKAYMDELEQVFIRNGKVMLTRAQITGFIEAYGLRKNFGITAQEVETDLHEIMRKY